MFEVYNSQGVRVATTDNEIHADNMAWAYDGYYIRVR